MKKLNLGCGRHVLDGWVNVDVQVSLKAPRSPEILCDLKTIPLPDGCAEEVMAIHVFEHFYFWETPAVLAEWRRLLTPGGSLVLELPNLMKCCRNILEGRTLARGGKDPDQLGMWGLFGDPRDNDPYMTHRWGWTPKTLRSLLESSGFAEVRETMPKWHRAGRDHRDMRLEAIRG